MRVSESDIAESFEQSLRTVICASLAPLIGPSCTESVSALTFASRDFDFGTPLRPNHAAAVLLSVRSHAAALRPQCAADEAYARALCRAKIRSPEQIRSPQDVLDDLIAAIEARPEGVSPTEATQATERLRKRFRWLVFTLCRDPDATQKVQLLQAAFGVDDPTHQAAISAAMACSVPQYAAAELRQRRAYVDRLASFQGEASHPWADAERQRIDTLMATFAEMRPEKAPGIVLAKVLGVRDCETELSATATINFAGQGAKEFVSEGKTSKQFWGHEFHL